MAEQFLEEIYRDAIVTSELRDTVAYIARTDYYNARAVFNNAMSRMENMLERYANDDPVAANRLQDSALKAINAWGEFSLVTGVINGELLPQIYEYLKGFNPIDVEDGNYLLKSSASGFLTVKDVESNEFLHDIFDPMLEAEKITDVLYNPWAEKYIIFGGGLGYLPYRLWKRSGEAAKIIVFEDDEKIIEYARHYGVLDWIDGESLDVRYIPDINMAIVSFYKEVDLEDKSRVTYVTPYKKKKYKDAYNGSFLALVYRIEHTFVSYGINETNLWENRKLPSVPFKDLFESINGDTWIVVAAGPSLNYNMDFVKENVGISRIVAVNTVLRRFAKERIVPDLSVAADPFGQIPEHLDGIEEFTKSIPMVADWLLCWKYAYRYRGEKCFIHTPAGECIENYNPNNEDVWDVFGTVSALAIEAALRLGAKKIYLVGLDLAFPGNEVHAKDMPHEKIEYKSEAILVPSVDGTMVETTPVFNDFRIGIEEIIARNPNVEFINMSRNGALIKGTKKG